MKNGAVSLSEVGVRVGGANVDFLLSIGMKPFAEPGFMPEGPASGRTTVFRYRGNVTPPRDYRQRATHIRPGGMRSKSWFWNIISPPQAVTAITIELTPDPCGGAHT